jgi:D-glycero-D-manno-heptose 1,7-bisphosphate phosphatase
VTHPAVFVDRDGTLVDDPPPGYLSDPARVTPFPGTAEAINRLHALGYLVVVVTNQAGISRGRVTWEQYRAVAARLDQLLAAEGARLDGTYVCPHAPEIDGDCPCRKPKLLLYEQAGTDLGIDFSRSYWVGDRITDLTPALSLGGHAILVLTGNGADHRESAVAQGLPVVAGLAAAVSAIAARQ